MFIVSDLVNCSVPEVPDAMSAAIEEIKNGYAYDDRYRFQEAMFEPPHVWVFTNTMPDTKLLSLDRWKFWTITDDNRLQPFYNTPTLKLNIIDTMKLTNN